jgi:hypothetical protein
VETYPFVFFFIHYLHIKKNITIFVSLKKNENMKSIKEWFEVFEVFENGNSITLFSNAELEPCVLFYRSNKSAKPNIKIDKWIQTSTIDKPIPYKSILN